MNTIKVNRKDIPSKTDTPIFDYCRKLIGDGVNPDTRLEIYREREEFDVAVTSIGEGAKFTVTNNYFATYRDSHQRKDLKGTTDARRDSLMSLNGSDGDKYHNA